MSQGPGLIALFGSGETSPSGRKVYDWVFSRLTRPVRVAVLETPAGFQPNSAIVAGKVGEFLENRLQNFRPELSIVAARERETAYSPDDPEILSPVLAANAIFLGPGSPTYAVRQLEGSLAWNYLRAQHRMGSALLFASAATIAISARALPVYEIYKVGEQLHWSRGLDLFREFGLSITFVPHWDNHEGGQELDTSHCFMGLERFQRLLAVLPPEQTVVGIDEHTALVMDLRAGNCVVMGRGGVTVMRDGATERCSSGHSFPIRLLGEVRLPASNDGIPEEVWRLAESARVDAASEVSVMEPPREVLELVREREEARACRDWPAADAIRGKIAAAGWQVADTPEGPQLSSMG